MIGLDTNVLTRYFVTSSDEPSRPHGESARQLLESGQRLLASKTVLLEREWVLRRLV